MQGTRGYRPPAILAGGDCNVVAVARSLARAGIAVYTLNRRGFVGAASRHLRQLPVFVPPGREERRAWREFLLGEAARPLRGAVLIAGSDSGVELLAHHRDELREHYRLDVASPKAQLGMLDKRAVAEAARAAGVPAPRHWMVEKPADLDAVRDELVFPLLVKPRHTFRFSARAGRKFLVADDLDEVRAGLARMEAAGLGCLLLEKIPGPDDRLCSYYTYLDEDARPVFDYTKRILRRFPENEGGACYHAVGDPDPEVRELGLRFLQGARALGLGNVEFKRDVRDGELKLIECNPRLTAAQPLLVACGLDLGRFAYLRALGEPASLPATYRTDLRLWHSVEDLQAFLALRREGRLTWPGWLRSIARPQVLPYWSWRDPGPSLVLLGRRLLSLARKGLR